MPRPSEVKSAMIPYLSSAQKDEWYTNRVQFAVTEIRYVADKAFQQKGKIQVQSQWELTVIRLDDNERTEYVLSLSSNAIRDRWMNNIPYTAISEDDPLAPCVLNKIDVGNIQPAWELADPS